MPNDTDPPNAKAWVRAPARCADKFAFTMQVVVAKT
jgi:hypothetical protein